MFRISLLVAVVACSSPPADAPPDNSGADAPAPEPDAPALPVDANTPVDMGPPVDAAPPPACKTVFGSHTVVGGDVVTTCLTDDTETDTFIFTSPSHPAGGILRFKLEFTECQLAFELYMEKDAQFPWTRSDNSFDTDNLAELDDNIIALVEPDANHQLFIKKRRPFSGTCSYTLTTTFTPLADPFERNQSLTTANPITVGQSVSALFACPAPRRFPLGGECNDNMKIDLPAGSYGLTWNLPSSSYPNINPCLTMKCFADDNSGQNLDTFDCEANGGTIIFSHSFNVPKPSHCTIMLHGSDNGQNATAFSTENPISSLRGTATPYTFRIVAQ